MRQSLAGSSQLVLPGNAVQEIMHYNPAGGVYRDVGIP